MKVLKFGGSSISTPSRVKHIHNLIEERYKKGEELAVVFSAFGGVTDQLIYAAKLASKGKEAYKEKVDELKMRHISVVHELFTEDSSGQVLSTVEANFETLENLLLGVYLVREASLRTMDYILSFGEVTSNYIIANFFASKGISSQYVDARKIIKTNKNFGQAKVNFEITNQLIVDEFEKFRRTIPIITGFISSDVGGLTTTLG